MTNKIKPNQKLLYFLLRELTTTCVVAGIGLAIFHLLRYLITKWEGQARTSAFFLSLKGYRRLVVTLEVKIQKLYRVHEFLTDLFIRYLDILFSSSMCGSNAHRSPTKYFFHPWAGSDRFPGDFCETIFGARFNWTYSRVGGKNYIPALVQPGSSYVHSSVPLLSSGNLWPQLVPIHAMNRECPEYLELYYESYACNMTEVDTGFPPGRRETETPQIYNTHWIWHTNWNRHYFTKIFTLANKTFKSIEMVSL